MPYRSVIEKTKTSNIEFDVQMPRDVEKRMYGYTNKDRDKSRCFSGAGRVGLVGFDVVGRGRGDQLRAFSNMANQAAASA